MARRRLVLASASPARLRQLQLAGFAPEVVVSGVDESGLDHLTAGEAAALLAQRKAEAVAAMAGVAGSVVVGCDSILAFEGAALGKPTSPEDAVRRWKAMRGRCGVLTTGHRVIDTRQGRSAGGVAETLVRFGTPSDDEIVAYVATGEPLHVAGAFTLDGLSGPFVDGVDGDPGAVIGLSLPLFRALLAELDLTVMDLWG
jgi:septum formation protein